MILLYYIVYCHVNEHLSFMSHHHAQLRFVFFVFATPLLEFKIEWKYGRIICILRRKMTSEILRPN